MMAFSISAMVMSAPGAVYRSSGCKALVSGMFWGPKFEENLSCGTRVMGPGRCIDHHWRRTATDCFVMSCESFDHEEA